MNVRLRPEPGREVDAIRELRSRFNDAIAAHDAERIGECWAPDLHVGTSAGAPLVGREQVRRAFEQFFADPDFLRFVRTPDRILIGEDGRTAAEQGAWTGHWRSSRVQSGLYLAAWHKAGRYWKLASELYVPLSE